MSDKSDLEGDTDAIKQSEAKIMEANLAEFQWDRDTWSTTDKYFSQPRILAHNQLNSFNDFVENVIPSLIKNHNPIVVGHDWDPTTEKFRVRYEVEFAGQPYMSRPQINEGSGTIKNLFPNEARLRGLSYSAYMYLDVTHRLFENDVLLHEKTESQIPFKFPCMLHSDYCYLQSSNAESLRQMGECPYDLGGYFIINGSEKVIISQERPVDNKVLCFRQKKESKFDEIVEIRSTIDQRFYPVRNNWLALTLPKEGEADQYLRISFPYLTNSTPIPLMVVFRAIGVTTDQEIFEMIVGSNADRPGISDDMVSLILPSFEELVDVTDDQVGPDGRIKRSRQRLRKKITTQDEALLFISRHIAMNMEYLENKLPARLSEGERARQRDIAKRQYVLDILRRDLLPHMGFDFRRKAMFLGHMTWIMISCKLGLRDYDVRDHYANKRLDLAGPLLKKLFQGSFGRLIKEIKREVNRQLEDNTTATFTLHPGLRKVIQNCNMEAPIKKALSTGDFTPSKNANLFSSTNMGVAQVLQRLSYMAYISNIRRIATPMEKAGGKITEPRKLDPTQYGYVCPNETPEGQQVGIVKNLAMTATITISSSTLGLKTALKRLGVITPIEEMDPRLIYYQVKVMLNGEWIGCTTEPRRIFLMTKRFKRDGTFSPFIGIYWNFEQRELHIRTDGGRYSRPLYVVEKYKNQWVPKIALEWDKAKGMNFKELVRNGYVEYIDPEECENCMIAMTSTDLSNNSEQKPEFYSYTHLELHPSMALGVVSQMIPFSDHNQSPRNCYQCLWKETGIVMADGTIKKIKDVQVGDKVISMDIDNLTEIVTTVINQYVKTTDKRIIKLTTKKNRLELVCTEDHPVLTLGGWKEAGKLEPTDYIVLSEKLGFDYLDTIEEHENVEIADITVDSDCHSFITESGIVVHNSSMGKQALGLYATNFNQRMDTMAHVLCYPQKPLVTTRTNRYANLERLPHGQQCIVAVACYTGYNQEDSVLLNKAAIERGKFNSLYFKTYVSEMNPHKSSTAEEERFGRPDPQRTQGIKHGVDAYKHLDDDGFAKIGSFVRTNDVLIGKTVKMKEEIKSITGRRITHSDISLQVKPGDYGYVDKRIPSMGSVKNLNADNNPFAKLRIAQLRKPVIGDKVACAFEDTTILTEKRGWQYFYDLEVDDKVATLVDDKYLVYETPTDYFEYDHDGDMYKVDSQLVNQLVTTNHRMYIQKRDKPHYELEEAKYVVGKRMKFKRDAVYQAKNQEFFTLPGFSSIFGKHKEEVTYGDFNLEMNDWLTLFGMWLAEGWTQYHKNSTTYGQVFFAANKPRVRKELERISDKYQLGFAGNEEHKWYSSHKQLFAYLKPLSVGATNKSLPQWAFNLSPSQSQVLIHGLMLGDGYLKEEGKKMNHYHYFTSSSQLADDVQKLALHAGWSANIKTRSEAGTEVMFKDHLSVTTADAKVVQIIRTKNNPQINHGHVTAQRGEKHDSIVKCKGKVYCVTVPSGVIYCRRNGIPSWTGNSRMAQKGTTGLILAEADMPFTDAGMVPDIVMNPHALPSRMTVGQMLECIFGKAACLQSEVKDSTPFTHFDQEEIHKILEEFGYERNGEEVMYNGFTGEMMKTTIFVGPVYYQRLKHMVKDKIHARATGRVNNLTKQSVEGRNQGGGLRLTLACVENKISASPLLWGDMIKFREGPVKYWYQPITVM